MWTDAAAELRRLSEEESDSDETETYATYQVEIALGLGHLDEALAPATAAPEDDPRATWFALASVRMGDVVTAKKWLAGSETAFWRAAEAEGDTWLELGDPVRAADAYLRARSHNGRLAAALEAMGEDREAYRAYESALRRVVFLDPELVERYAACAERIGRPKAATWIRSVYARAAQSDPAAV